MNPAEQITIAVNGEPREIAAGSNVAEMLEQLGVDSQRVAVELNRVIARKPDWTSTIVESGAQVEIVEFVGGG
jgi:thiamine biosynthesis protein ThiS